MLYGPLKCVSDYWLRKVGSAGNSTPHFVGPKEDVIPQKVEMLCPALVSFYNLPLSEKERQQVSEYTHKAQLDEEWAFHAEGGSSALRLSSSWGRAQ